MTRKTINGMTIGWRHGYVLLSMLMMVLVAACQQEPVQSSALEDDLTSDEYDITTGDDLTTEVATLSKQGGNCDHDNDCLDGVDSTIDWCDDGDCHHEERWECEEHGSHCSKHNDCLDGDSDTLDWCYDNSCHHAERDSGDCA